jgi:hypothetical protein
MVVLAVAGPPLRGEQTMMDSLRTMPPKVRLEWLYHRGIEMPGYAGSRMTDSGLALVGKWGRGPAAEVTGKDTLVVLTLGSEVALLSFASPDSPRVLSEIQFPSLTAQSYLKDSLLYSSSNADLEIWNVADPTQPVRRGQIPAPVGDFWIRDTLLFFIRSDTFHVLSIANPANLYQLGSAPEAGSATTGSGNTVVVCQSAGFAFVDVSNPASPHEVGTYPCGHTLSATARGNLVCASYEETSEPYPAHFITLDISTPGSPLLLANLDNLGGYDIYLDSSLALVSGRSWPDQPFQIISIADSTHPALLDSCLTTERYNWGVWASLSLRRAFVADEYDGLAVVDISSMNNAVLDTWVLKTGAAVDLSINGQYCYVAGDMSGLRVLDVSDPTRPFCVAGLDSAFFDTRCNTVTALDSLAYMNWRPNPYFRTVSVADPLHPQIVAGCSLFNWAEDMALRDSLVYVAEDNRFQILNVARPRQPQVVGTCGVQNASMDLFLLDTLAFVGSWPSPIIDISDPVHPETVGSIPLPLGGVFVRDTFAYAVMDYDSFFVYSVANPAAPVRLGSLDFSGGQQYAEYNVDIEVLDTVAYIGGWHLKTVSVADPRNPREVGTRWNPPSSYIPRLSYAPPYLYVACSDGGVCVLETLQTGISEIAARPLVGLVRVAPTVTAGRVRFWFDDAKPWRGRVTVYNASGAEFAQASASRAVSDAGEIDLTNAPGGVYLLRFKTDRGSCFAKVVKTTRR